ncbi:TIGR03086 family metal-binding protein [Streptomyces sp. NPDC006172]|uniref:TIGR03086 family metal-binding protein n=1 Tax=Streptomyces sp. NPDC006172 TaxID=3154470 RepID=UPI0033FF4F73
MQPADVMTRASDVAVGIVRGVAPEHLDGPTPCPELTVRGVVNHLVLWTGVRGRACALKQPPQEVADDHDFTGDADWAQAYAVRSAATAAAWSDPAAWEGETSLTGAGSMPALFVGGIVLCEWVLHAWDLAVATGQEPTVDDDLAAAVYADVAGRAEIARRYGAFGSEVPVPATATLFDRALGLSGRDPSWKRPVRRGSPSPRSSSDL